MVHVSILIISYLVTFSVNANADIMTLRGFKDVAVVEGKEFPGTDLAVLTADNSQQCVRLCWLFSNCSMVTFYPRKLRCRLTNELPVDLNTMLVRNDGAITVDMRIAKVDKPRLYGCDHRNCKLDELCVPVVDPDSYKCLPLGYKKCPSMPPSVANSDITMEGLSKVTYSCSDGYVISGSNNAASCDQGTGQWSPIDVTCTFTDCGPPPELSGASPTGNDTFYSARVVYHCFDGYISNSSSMAITCQDNNQWTPLPDRCVLVTCPEPTNVMNGTARVLERVFANAPPNGAEMNLNLAYGGSALHSCDEGFQSPTRPEFRSQCQSDGTWESTSSFTCNPVDCGRPPAIANTWSSFNLTTFQSKAAYMCVEGFEIVNGSTEELTCDANGTWSRSEVTCVMVDCGMPPEEKNATAAYYMTTYLSETNYTCDEPTYMYPGPVQPRSCRASGQWSNESVSCIACGKPRDFFRAFFEISSLAEDYYVAKYYCEEGYSHKGVKSEYDHVGSMCLPGASEWTRMEVQCEMISCGKLPEIANATVLTSNGTFFNSVATYSCNTGFAHAQSNSTSLTCDADGSWGEDSVQISCVQISCGPPPAVNNSFHEIDDKSNSETFVFNSTVVYRCEEGFALTGGSNIKRCLAEGIWEDTPINCEAIDCKDPTNIPNATWSIEKTDTGIHAVYACVDGYRLMNASNNLVKCVDGSWRGLENDAGNGNAISCLPVDCGSPPKVNGSKEDFNSTRYGDVVIYTCENGKTWESVCQQNGAWSSMNDSNASMCQYSSCSAPPNVPNAAVLTVIHAAKSISPATAASVPSISSTEGSGNWGEPDDQSADNTPSDGFQSESGLDGDSKLTSSISTGESHSIGDIVVYRCGEGHIFAANQSTFGYECQSSGLWQRMILSSDSDVLPEISIANVIGEVDGEGVGNVVCFPVDCGKPPSLIDGNATINATTYGSNATYACEIGMTLADTNISSRICQADGRWSNESIACIKDGCGPPPSIPNALIFSLEGTRQSDVVTYECETGYELSALEGSTSFICTGGLWIGQLRGEFCLPVDCKTPPKISDAMTEYTETIYGSVVTYHCGDGHEPSGNGTKRCHENGTWTGDDSFHCPPEGKCQEPTKLKHGDFKLHGDLGVGTVASYSCHSGYELQENRSSITCLGNYSWSNDVYCLKLECGAVPEVANTEYLLRLIDGTLKAFYSCVEGYVTTGGDESLYCSSSNKDTIWTGVEMICDVDPCSQPPNVDHATAQLSLNEVGSYAVYICEEGYEHWWFDSKSCTPDEGWGGGKVQCNITDCGTPPDVINAHKSLKRTTYNSEVIYSCDQGYRFTTSKFKRICTESGKWSAGFIECVNKSLAVCEEPPEKQHSNVSHGSLVAISNPIATYVCDVGYRQYQRTFQILCRVFRWYDRLQSNRCNPVTCSNPPDIDNAIFAHNVTDVYGSKVDYECNEGYQLAGPGSKICQADGNWSPEVTECYHAAAVYCLEPPHIDNSIVQVHSYNGKAVYTCLQGYTGGGDVRCQKGNWSPTSHIKCNPLDCGTPEEFPDANMSVHQTTFGRRAIYECTYDIRKNSRPFISVCNSSGIWSLMANPCERKDIPCPQPFPQIGNATLELKETHGHFIIVYTCYNGYTTTGGQNNYFSACASGNWTRIDDSSVCLPVGECVTTPVIENADHSIVSKAFQGTLNLVFMSTYTCHKGYKPRVTNETVSDTGEVFALCYPSTGWQELPACDLVDCGPFLASSDIKIPYGAAELNQTTYLSEANVTCQAPFLGPSKISVCQDNGKWSQINMTCQDSYCHDPPSFPNGSLAPSELYSPQVNKVSSSWVANCDENYQYLGTPVPVTCQLNTDTFEEEWAVSNASFCVRSHWLKPAIPFKSQLHIDKTKYFNKITVCFDATYIGSGKETPNNIVMSFTDMDLSQPKPVQIRLNAYTTKAALEHRLNAEGVTQLVAEKSFVFTSQQVVSVCGQINIYDSTFVATVNGEYLGQFEYPTMPTPNETLSWAQYVIIDQNILLISVQTKYESDLTIPNSNDILGSTRL